MPKTQYVQLEQGLFAHPDYVHTLRQKNLATFDAVFAFSQGRHINPGPLPPHRSRVSFPLSDSGPTVYLKRYVQPPVKEQITNWIQHRRYACTAEYDHLPTQELDAVPQTIAYGCRRKGLFENRSFIMIREIENAKSLEEKLPEFLHDFTNPDPIRQRRKFIRKLADFIRRFHDTGYRHRDLYLSHIFYDSSENFHLIDLQRMFKPVLLAQRFRMKDIAQLYFSTPASRIPRTDRLRFYKHYRQKSKLNRLDKLFICQVKSKCQRIARRDRKRGKPIPFQDQ